MKRYNSKIGIGIVLIISSVIGITSYFLFQEKEYLGLFINSAVVLFMYHIFTTTYYLIDNKSLIIKASFLVNLEIPIQSINLILKSNSPISSPANSLDRLKIVYKNKQKSILISPKAKLNFIKDLQKINPNIQVSI